MPGSRHCSLTTIHCLLIAVPSSLTPSQSALTNTASRGVAAWLLNSCICNTYRTPPKFIKSPGFKSLIGSTSEPPYFKSLFWQHIRKKGGRGGGNLKVNDLPKFVEPSNLQVPCS